MGQATRTNFFVAWNQTHFLFVHSSVRPAGHDKGLLWAQHVASCLERLWLFLRAPWMLCLWRCHSEHTKTRQRSVTFSQYCQFIALAFSSKTKITWCQMQTLRSPLSCSVAKKKRMLSGSTASVTNKLMSTELQISVARQVWLWQSVIHISCPVLLPCAEVAPKMCIVSD